jgi:hypothetical protein
MPDSWRNIASLTMSAASSDFEHTNPCTPESAPFLVEEVRSNQGSQKLMALIKLISELLDAKQERLIEKDSQRSFPNPSD